MYLSPQLWRMLHDCTIRTSVSSKEVTVNTAPPRGLMLLEIGDHSSRNPSGRELCIRWWFHQRTFSNESVLFQQNKCLPFGQWGPTNRCFCWHFHRQTGTELFPLWASLSARNSPATPLAAWWKHFVKAIAWLRGFKHFENCLLGQGTVVGWTLSCRCFWRRVHSPQGLACQLWSCPRSSLTCTVLNAYPVALIFHWFLCPMRAVV